LLLHNRVDLACFLETLCIAVKSVNGDGQLSRLQSVRYKRLSGDRHLCTSRCVW